MSEFTKDTLIERGDWVEILAAERAKVATLQDRSYALAVAIIGGEDAPGYADSVPTEVLERQARSQIRDRNNADDALAAERAKVATLRAALGEAGRFTAELAHVVREPDMDQVSRAVARIAALLRETGGGDV